MPHAVPHTFPTLRRSNGVPPRRSLLLMGAGMSHGLAPLPEQLLEEKGEKASAKLGCSPPAAAETLYAWADRAVTHLIAANESNPKLTLGRSLDLLTEPRWLGSGSTERNAPRHRVVARFGREGLWEQVWSFNWDCVQESALENVGIVRDGVDPRLPWPSGFRTFITAQECQQVAEDNVVHIIKPHGCVRALIEAEREQNAGNDARAFQLAARFLITQTELTSLNTNGDPTQTFIFATLCSRMSAHPLVTVGWSAGETYLLDHIENNVRPQLLMRPLAADELSIVDLRFHTGHPRLAQCYNTAAAQAHVPVAAVGLTTDNLFLWIQALYALERLRLTVAAIPADVQAVAAIEATLGAPPDSRHFSVDWVDNFLPVWVRLCWRCGLVPFYDAHSQLLPIEEFNLERLDEHVPWNLSGCARPDLIAAARLLAALHRSGSGHDWDFISFPGGFYRARDSLLLVPLPAWRTGADNELRGLRPLVNAVQRSGAQPVERLGILPLMADVVPPNASVVAVLRESLAHRIGMAAFAQSSAIVVMDFASL